MLHLPRWCYDMIISVWIHCYIIYDIWWYSTIYVYDMYSIYICIYIYIYIYTIHIYIHTPVLHPMLRYSSAPRPSLQRWRLPGRFLDQGCHPLGRGQRDAAALLRDGRAERHHRVDSTGAVGSRKNGQVMGDLYGDLTVFIVIWQVSWGL